MHQCIFQPSFDLFFLQGFALTAALFRYGKLNTARQLFQLGANPEATNLQGQKALDLTKTVTSLFEIGLSQGSFPVHERFSG